MDYAILEPNAFFMVQDPATGAVSYTRDGQFHRAEREDGFYLMTGSGKLVLDQNREPLKAEVPDVDKIQAEMGERRMKTRLRTRRMRKTRKINPGSASTPLPIQAV